MVLYRVFSQEHRIHYLAHPCSVAVLFQISCLILTFLSPLFTSYFTGGFYYKQLTYTERPNIVFSNQYHILIESLNSLRISSTDLRFNTLLRSSYFPSNSRASLPQDVDNDGNIDQLIIDVDTLLSSSIAGHTMKLFFIFDYALNAYPKINMSSLAYIELKVPPTIGARSAVTIYGRLRFEQRQALRTYETDATLQNPIIDFNSNNIPPSFDDALTNYYNRKYLTIFEPDHIQWTRDSDTSSTGVIVRIRLVVNVGQQAVRFIPNFWREFRWSWIQYAASLVPFFYVANKVKEFVFSAGLVRTVAIKDF